MTVAAILACVIIGVSDGDTLTARCETEQGFENLKIRLSEIDAPERGQAFGNRSKQHLAELCFGKHADVAAIGKDRYLRTVAHVSCDKVDAGTEQVRAGMAWVFDRYVTDRSLYDLQEAARSAHRGLWADPQPTAPWVWRASKQSNARS